MNEFDIIENTLAWLSSYKETDEYRLVLHLSDEMKNDEVLSKLTEEMNQKKSKYEEAKPMKDYYPNFKKIVEEYIIAKTNLQNYPLYQSYTEALSKVNLTLKKCSDQLNDVLSAVYIDTVKSCKKV